LFLEGKFEILSSDETVEIGGEEFAFRENGHLTLLSIQITLDFLGFYISGSLKILFS